MKKITNNGLCPHCGKDTHQRLIVVHPCITPRTFEDIEGLIDIHTDIEGARESLKAMRYYEDDEDEYFVAVCEKCTQLLIYNNYGRELKKEYFAEAWLVWPSLEPLHYSVPENI